MSLIKKRVSPQRVSVSPRPLWRMRVHESRVPRWMEQERSPLLHGTVLSVPDAAEKSPVHGFLSPEKGCPGVGLGSPRHLLPALWKIGVLTSVEFFQRLNLACYK